MTGMYPIVMPLQFSGFHSALSVSESGGGLGKHTASPFGLIMLRDKNYPLALSLSQGSSVMCFPHCITHFFIPLLSATIFFSFFFFSFY